ncbi:MAG: quinone-dependent dihydroorotate dehydrogenase [Flavobacteriales bacterium]|jgi:dihydroorotate dehydrogenase
MYRRIIKPIFFLLPAERAHYLAMNLLKVALATPVVGAMMRKRFNYRHPSLQRELFGLNFENPVGLAAGFDKDARWVDELACLGFGFIEIGTVTPLAQPGNDKPRLFRLPADEALINRMGFNNGGSKAAAERLKKRSSKIIVGGNIGKNKLTPNEEALSDYLKCFEDLFDVVDYFAVNVSSPNTPGLRALQDKEPLLHLLLTLQQRNLQKEKPKPILLKIAPDLTNGQLDDIIQIVAESGIAGVIATNTTIERAPLISSAADIAACGAGGLSGKPLRERSTEVIRYLKQQSGNAFPVIGVGGIHTAQDAIEKLDAGADLVQVYTGFVYEGPGVASAICEGLVGTGD